MWERSSPIFAGFWKRLAAYFLDFFFLACLVLSLLLAGILIAHMMGIPTEVIQGWLERQELRSNRPMARIVDVLITLFYFSAMESSPFQATLGKLAMGIKVTDIYYNRIGFWSAVGRNVCKVFSLLTLGFGFLMIGFTARKQGLHDFATDSLVVCRCAQPAAPEET